MITDCIIPFIINIAEFAIAILFLLSFMYKKESANRIVACITVLFCATVLFVINIWRIAWVNTVVGFFLFFLIAGMFCKGNIALLVAFSVILITLSATSELISGFALLIISNTKPAELLDNQYINILTGAFGKIILVLIIILLRHVFPRKYLFYKKSELFPLIIFPAFGMSAMYVIIYFSAELHLPTVQKLFLILLQIGLLASSVLVFFIYDSALHKQELEAQLRISEKAHEANELLFKEQQRSIETGRGYIHDFTNHLNNIKKLYKDGNAEAAEYHDNLINQFEDIIAFRMIDVNNHVISNIFERVRQQCKLNDIDLVLDVQYDQLAFITPIDSSILFDNLFDNAISACMQLQASRWLNTKLNKVGRYVIIEVRNSKNNLIKKEGQRFLSTRRKYESPGCGVENIRAVSERYQGDILVEHSDNEFSVIIRLSDYSLH